MPIFSWFKALSRAIQALTNAVVALNETQVKLGPALDRLETLERYRHQFEAEVHGLLLKADGKLKAASSAEQRERQLKKANENRLLDSLDEIGEGRTEASPAFSDHVERGDAQGLPPVRVALATNNKTHAVRTKWGIA